jgi:Tol biopolymer transport system component
VSRYRCLNVLLGATLLGTTGAVSQSLAQQPVQWITRDSAVLDQWPYVAPDGHTITFSRSTDGGATWQLMMIDRAGGVARPFLQNPPVVSATRGSWSRRHNRLAFTGGTRNDETTAVWVSNATGTEVTRIAALNVSPRLMYPSWTPDGQSVVAVDYGAAGGSTLVRLDLTTGVTVPLTQPAQFLVGMPTVSPDGEWIAFAGQQNLGRSYDQQKNQIWLLPRSGPPREVSRGQGRQPDWSPDGKWLAFTSTRGDSAGRPAIFIVAREGGVPVQLTEHEVNAGHPVWSPDGRWLVFYASLPEKQTAKGLAVIGVPERH